MPSRGTEGSRKARTQAPKGSSSHASAKKHRKRRKVISTAQRHGKRMHERRESVHRAAEEDREANRIAEREE